MALDILVVDDEQDIRELVAGVLSDEGYGCRTAGDSTTALRLIDELEGCIAVARRAAFVAFVGQHPGNELADILFVVHHEDVERH